MTEQEFAARVERLELRSRKSPGLFRLQVILLMLFGYAAVTGLLGLAVVVAAGMTLLCIAHPIFLVKLFKIIWLPVVFVWDVLRSLFVRLDPPVGKDITSEPLPALQRVVADVRQQRGGVPLDRILLTRDFNAGVVQLPRFGLLGGSRNYLVLGFPLLSTLSTTQLRSVLAHEFGHLSAGDSRLAGRIYRMRMTWGLLHERYSSTKGGGYLLRRFMGWYWPRFNAFAFVLSRQQEYAADQMAATVAGAEATGQALILTNVAAAHQSEHFWGGALQACRS
jgi:Zn-dependent protease with chaperone function